MAYENSDQHWPAQWKRLVEGDAKGMAWGPWKPTAGTLNGKTAEELRFWAANCTAKISFYLGRMPAEDQDNDGYWEVRMYWHSQRKRFLLEAAARLSEETPLGPGFMVDPTTQRGKWNLDFKESSGLKRSTDHLSAIRPLIPKPGGWPGAQPALYTKRSFETMEEGINGHGYQALQEESAPPPSPIAPQEEELPPPLLLTLDLKRPFKTPRRSERLKDKNRLECDEVLEIDEPPSP